MPAIILIPSATQRQFRTMLFILQRKNAAIEKIVEPFLTNEIRADEAGIANYVIIQTIIGIISLIFIFFIVSPTPGKKSRQISGKKICKLMIENSLIMILFVIVRLIFIGERQS